jgi:hypothetical protein
MCQSLGSIPTTRHIQKINKGRKEGRGRERKKGKKEGRRKERRKKVKT